ECIPLNLNLPVFLFFPVTFIQTMNPLEYSLDPVPPIILNHGIHQINIPLYVKDVSRQFLDVVKNNMALTIVMPSPQDPSSINWAIEFLDEKTLENTFLQTIIAQEHGILHDIALIDEAGIRHRFREYLRKLALFTADGEPLNLIAEIKNNKVVIQTKTKETTKLYKKEW
ncbi:hypothetical protein X556_0697, partial [Chlamydia pneumoniae B21]